MGYYTDDHIQKRSQIETLRRQIAELEEELENSDLGPEGKRKLEDLKKQLSEFRA